MRFPLQVGGSTLVEGVGAALTLFDANGRLIALITDPANKGLTPSARQCADALELADAVNERHVVFPHHATSPSAHRA